MNYEGLPEELRGGMQRYIEHGMLPGDFLTAVLENDLCEAVGRADTANRHRLVEIVGWLYNEGPMGCWGTREKVMNWRGVENADL